MDEATAKLIAELAELKESARIAQERARDAEESANADRERARIAQESARIAQEHARIAQESASADRERARQAGERASKAEERAVKAESRQAPSRFLDYVQYAEEELYATFYVEPNSKSTSSGTTTTVNGKYYPRRLRVWHDFASAHPTNFGTLTALFADQAIFPSLTDVEGVRRDISPDGSADELDLRTFIRTCIEKPAARIVAHYLHLRQHPTIGRIGFKNNAYGLQAETDEADAEGTGAGASNSNERPRKRISPVKRIGVPDRWGLAFLHDDSRTIIFVGEYKAAHKLRPQKLRKVLSTPPRESVFIDALRGKGDTTPKDATQAGASSSTTAPTYSAGQHQPTGAAPVAHVLCQAFHYMVTSGLEFGYVASGDGLIFLRVPEDDPSTLYYFMAVFPVAAIRDQQARLAANRGVRRLENTAVAHMCSFGLWTYDSAARPATWIRDATENHLVQWPIPYDERPLSAMAASLAVPILPRRDGDGGDDGDDDARGRGDGAVGTRGEGGPLQPHPARGNTHASLPTRSQPHGYLPPTTGASATGPQNSPPMMGPYVIEPPTLPYCTQACLLGLCRGLPLDDRCPNVELHRAAAPAAPAASPRQQQQQQEEEQQQQSGHQQQQIADNSHPLAGDELRSRLVTQLDEYLEKDCECLDKYGCFGRHGVLFKVTLTGYGYTFVAKGVQAVHRHILGKEAAVYSYLEAFQGRLIPVFMGLIDLASPYPLHTCALVSHMMLLSWAGPSLVSRRGAQQLPQDIDLEAEAEKTEQELGAAGLWNDDIRHTNMTWNAEARRVMQIDFDQAEVPARPAQRIEELEQASPVSTASTAVPLSPALLPRQIKRTFDDSSWEQVASPQRDTKRLRGN